MINPNKDGFPADYSQYYYYCRIHIVEQAKSKLIECNQVLLSVSKDDVACECKDDAPIKELFANDAKVQVLYQQYLRLYNDFITLADRLIEKNSISSYEDYASAMHVLVLNANVINEFILQNFDMTKRKLLKTKYQYNGKKRALSDIISQIENISYLLNCDNTFTEFINRHITTFLWLIGLLSFTIFALMLPSGNDIINIINNGWDANWTGVQIFDFVTTILALPILFGFGVALIVIGVKYRNKLILSEKLSNVRRRSYPLAAHPFKNQFSLKNITEIASIIKMFIK